MPFTVFEAITEARHEDPAFTERRHTDYVLRSRVTDYHQELVAKIAEFAPEELAVPLVFDMTAITPADGADLDDGDPIDWVRVLPTAEAELSGGGQVEVSVVGLEARYAQHRWPAVWIRSDRLYFQEDPSVPWADMNTLTIYYVPAPARMLDDSDELTFGDAARGVYVSHLAWRMAQRSPKEIQRPVVAFQEYWIHREKAFLRELIVRQNRKDRHSGLEHTTDLERIQ